MFEGNAMRMTNLFVPTLKESPADAQVDSHKLLVRGGFIRQLSAGIYCYLPLVRRVHLKIETSSARRWTGIGAQEFYLPALNPKRDLGGDRALGRHGPEHVPAQGPQGRGALPGDDRRRGLHPARAQRAALRTRQLPQTWYQIQTKFRDEARPKSGLLRVRQFTMKDATRSTRSRGPRRGLRGAPPRVRAASSRAAGLSSAQVDAHTGAMGGSGSTEFMVPTDAGEDDIAVLPEACGYAANTEKAKSRVPAMTDTEGPTAVIEEFPDPGRPHDRGISKSWRAARRRRASSRRWCTWATTSSCSRSCAAITSSTRRSSRPRPGATCCGRRTRRRSRVAGRDAGSASAAWAFDAGLAGLHRPSASPAAPRMVTGANEDDFHLRGVERAARPRARRARPTCARVTLAKAARSATAARRLQGARGRATSSSSAPATRSAWARNVLDDGRQGGADRHGQLRHRRRAHRSPAAVELHHDADGIRWPLAIAPFHVALLPLQMQDASVRRTPRSSSTASSRPRASRCCSTTATSAPA